MATALPPSVAMIVGRYLRAHAATRALVTEIVSKTPDSMARPWVRVVQVGGAAATGSSSALHLVAPLIDLHCYAGSGNTQAEADRIARTVQAALADMVGVFEEDGAVVTGVPPRGMSMPLHSPDSDVGNPARERYIVTATVYAHAIA